MFYPRHHGYIFRHSIFASLQSGLMAPIQSSRLPQEQCTGQRILVEQ